MDKETVSNYGWIVICVLVIAVMVALATPFGSFIKTAVENTTQGLYDTSAGAINSTDLMHIAGQDFNGGDAGDGTGTNTPNPALNPNGIIPDGYEYIQNFEICMCGMTNFSGISKCSDCMTKFYLTPTAIPSGSVFPEINDYDGYETQDYYYQYHSSNYGGWRVIVKDRSKTAYEPILESINGEPITSVYQTFSDCAFLTTAPTIPNSVTNMESAFAGCTSLTTAPTIPSGVTNMESTFLFCTSLTDLSSLVIPNSVTNMYRTFCSCTSLTTTPKIQNGITNMESAFLSCTSLTDLSSFVIPNSVTNMYWAFRDCTSLITAPTIPSSVTNMFGTFYGCTSLTTVPNIPNSVTDMGSPFSGCTSLTVAPEISNIVTNMQSTFYNCTSLTTTPEISSSVTNMQGTFYNCTSLTTAPSIPSSVTKIRQTFDGCTSLTGNIEINTTPSSFNYQYCLRNTQITSVTGTTTLTLSQLKN